MIRKILFSTVAAASLTLGSFSAVAQTASANGVPAAADAAKCIPGTTRSQRGSDTRRASAKNSCATSASLAVARAPIEGEGIRGTASGTVVAILAAAAVIAGIVILADEDEDGDDLPVSP